MLLRSSAGVGLDVALAGLPFEQDIMDRATEFAFLPHVRLVTCSAEDLIVLKAFANRGQDRIDIEGVARRQRGQLDWAAILARLAPLVELKEEPEILAHARGLRRRWGL